ncbi:MAG TPA: hypothetical protein VK203_15055 [Nostocaceae cyanobacterium]|nr:hypothetical protein [Nostocaceae cyanobacterium]
MRVWYSNHSGLENSTISTNYENIPNFQVLTITPDILTEDITSSSTQQNVLITLTIPDAWMTSNSKSDSATTWSWFAIDVNEHIVTQCVYSATQSQQVPVTVSAYLPLNAGETYNICAKWKTDGGKLYIGSSTATLSVVNAI